MSPPPSETDRVRDRFRDRMFSRSGQLEASASERAWILGLLACALLARAPSLVLRPRFWAEDGTVYFAYARLHGMLESLLLIPTTSGPAGYLNLAANLPAWIAARFVPLEWSPLVPTLVAFGIQLLPVALVLYGEIPALARPMQRRIAAVLFVISPPLLAEVWGNATNSQIFLGLCALLILSEDLGTLGRRAYRVRAWILGLAALSGPYTVFLAPLFLLRVLLLRALAFEASTPLGAARSRALAGWVGLASFCQAGAYFWTREALGFSERGVGGGPLGGRLAALLHADLFQAFLGEALGTSFAKALGLLPAIASVAGGEATLPHLRTAGWLAAILLAGASGWLALGARRNTGPGRPRARERWLLEIMPALGAAWLSVSVGLAVGPLVVVERYSVLPGLAWLLAGVAAMDDRGSRTRRWLCRLGLAWALVVGAQSYFQEIPASALGQPSGQPSWAREVEAWRDSGDGLLRIWPYADPDPWFLYLPTEESAPGTRARLARPAHMVSDGPWRERSWQVDGLEHDFKMVIRLMASVPSSSLRFHLRFEDRRGETLGVARPPSFAAEQPFRWTVDRNDRRFAEVPMGAVRRITFAMKPEIGTESDTRAKPVRVLIQDLYLGPRIEGALEPLLPDGWTRAPGLASESSVADPADPAGAGRGQGALASAAVPASWILLALLVSWMSRSPGKAQDRLGLALPAVFVLASAASYALAHPSAQPLWMALLYWPLSRWIRPGKTSARHRLAFELAEGFCLVLVALRIPAVWLLLALPLGEKVWRVAGERRVRPRDDPNRNDPNRSNRLGLVAWLVGAGVGGGLGRALVSEESDPVSALEGAAGWAERAWRIGLGPEGWLGLYPLAFVALAMVLLAGERVASDATADNAAERGLRRTVLLAALLALNAAWIFLGPVVPMPTPLTLAVLYPAFWLLPDRWPSPRASRPRKGPADRETAAPLGSPRIVWGIWAAGLLAFAIYTLPELERRTAPADSIGELVLVEPAETGALPGADPQP